MVGASFCVYCPVSSSRIAAMSDSGESALIVATGEPLGLVSQPDLRRITGAGRRSGLAGTDTGAVPQGLSSMISRGRSRCDPRFMTSARVLRGPTRCSRRRCSAPMSPAPGRSSRRSPRPSAPSASRAARPGWRRRTASTRRPRSPGCAGPARRWPTPSARRRRSRCTVLRPASTPCQLAPHGRAGAPA